MNTFGLPFDSEPSKMHIFDHSIIQKSIEKNYFSIEDENNVEGYHFNHKIIEEKGSLLFDLVNEKELKKDYENVTFHIENQQIHSSKGVLVAKCSYFKKLFHKEGHEDVDFQLLSLKDFKSFLNFVLFKSLDNESIETLLNLYNFCFKYDVQPHNHFLEGKLKEIIFKFKQSSNLQGILSCYKGLEIKNFFFYETYKYLALNVSLFFKDKGKIPLQIWKDLLSSNFLNIDEFELLKNLIKLVQEQGIEYKELLKYVRVEYIPLESLCSCLKELKSLNIGYEEMIDLISFNIQSKYQNLTDKPQIFQVSRASRVSTPSSISVQFKVSYLDLERKLLGQFDVWNYKFFLTFEVLDGYLSIFLHNSLPLETFKYSLKVQFSITNFAEDVKLNQNIILKCKWNGTKKCGFENVATVGYLLNQGWICQNKEKDCFTLGVLFDRE